MANTWKSPVDGASPYHVVNADSNFTLGREDNPVLVHNAGASGAVVVTLPQDAKGGEVVVAVCLAAQALRLDPGGAGAVYAHKAAASYAKQADDKYLEGSAVGERVMLIADGNGDWVAVEQSDGAGAIGFNAVEA